LNLSRGTGIRGLTGIPTAAGRIIRPLQNITRQQIISYANQLNLGWREDSSNATTLYKRNKVRHQIIPQLEELNPAFRQSLARTQNRLKSAHNLLSHYVLHIQQDITEQNGNTFNININKLLEWPESEFILSEILRPFGFSYSICQEIYSSTNALSGKQFESPTHKLIKDRTTFIVEKKKAEKASVFYIEKEVQEIQTPIVLTFESINWNGKFDQNSDIALFDADKIEWPLTLRHWQQGDYIKPLGMNGLKKVSDYFIDQKFSLFQKESLWLLLSGNKIMWIVGHRMDGRFAIDANTKNVIKIEIKG
jgi:tRNA(Ile)-lysidine synthase